MRNSQLENYKIVQGTPRYRKLKIPKDGYVPKPSKIYYTVKRGDTLSHIAQKYKTSVRNIKRWNGLRSNTIRIGQKLQIHRK